MHTNHDVVMSESSEDDEDEGDFDDLANDLESSLVGQGPFSRAAGGSSANGTGRAGQTQLISSDDDEDDDDDDDSDFVNAFAEQPYQAPLQQPMQQQPPPQVQPQQRASIPQLSQHQQIPTAPASQQQSQPQQQVPAPTRPTQAGKKLPTTRKYDSDIASSSESDDDSD